jgi:hypothetical protein
MYHRQRMFLCLLLSLGVLVWSAPVRAANPPWIEPRALSIADLAGQVPDDVLSGALITSANAGIVVFQSSSWQGSALRLNTTIYGRVGHPDWLGGQPLTDLHTLGQTTHYDNMGSVSPESWLRIYENGQDLTNGLDYLFLRSPALVQPLAGAGEFDRYAALQTARQITTDGLHLPAHFGGWVQIRGDHPVLTGVFTIHPQNRPRVTYLGQQQANWQTYVGVGAMGAFAPLMSQLHVRYGDRHGRIPLQIPAGANYVLFIYPPSPGDPYHYDAANRGRLVGGTVRLSPDGAMLCSDLMASGAYPLNVIWQDADQSAGPYLSLLRNPVWLTPPEVVLPAGMAYNPCFTQGNCPESVLKQIHDAVMPIRIVYLHVDPPDTGYSYIPLRMADTQWVAGMAGSSQQAAAAATRKVYLPRLQRPAATPTPPSGCPCGAFTADGRMVGIVE